MRNKDSQLTKLGVFVGEGCLWTFFGDIYEDFKNHFDTRLFIPKKYHTPFFSERLSRQAYRNEMRSMLKNSDVCFFEWASGLLVDASHMPKEAPIITRLHSFELAEWVHKINWNCVDKIIFISEAMRNKFTARYPEQSGKAVLIYNAISVENFSAVHRDFDFSLGMLCTISPIKRVYEVILVVNELQKLGYQPKLRIAGAPSQGNFQDRYYVSVHRLVEKLNLVDAVHFYGQIDDVSAWLQEIDIFISNSYWEGVQTALLEAMAANCICLAHFWDGAEEVLPPENIYITDEELMQKLIKLSKLSDRDRKTMKDQMGMIVRKKFNIEDKKVALREIISSFL